MRALVRLLVSCRPSFSSRSYHSTSSVKKEPKKFVPKDWKIEPISPSGLDCLFVNKKSGEVTWFTPEGMTAEEIYAIPGAKNKYWYSVGQVEAYIQKMAKEKANGEPEYDPRVPDKT